MRAGLAGDPWIRYRDTGLYALPSIHNRLIFAQMVVEACRRKRFDVIAVEMPGSFGRAGALDHIREMAPATGMLLQPFGERVSVRLTGDREGTSPIEARRGLIVPITPADSIVTALRCPQLLASRWPDWHPEIIPVDAEYASCVRPPLRRRIMDDYDVVRRGLAAFNESWQTVWRDARVDPLDAMRERVMARHLARFIREGREVLFVCGAAHWHPISTLLDGGGADEPAGAATISGDHASRGRFRIVGLDPALAWLWGWLDDIPRVVWDFELACQDGTVGRWDKHAASERVLEVALDRARGAGLNVSARRLIKTSRYRHVLMCAAGRWTPELDDHLVHSAEACIGRTFADTLKRTALDYPKAEGGHQATAQFTRTADGRHVLRVGTDVFLCDADEGAVGAGRRLPLPVEPRLTGAERSTLRASNWVYRDWPAEQTLHNRLIARARLLAHRAERASTTVRPFAGDFGLGLAWRHTVRARASGSRELYVRHGKTGTLKSKCDERCPVVWIFDAHSTISGTFHGIVPREARSSMGLCFSGFYWLAESARLGDTPINQFKVAYCVSLMRGLMPPGRSRTQATVRAMVESFPETRRATVTPWDDESLGGLSGCDLAIGCAVKYAADHVVVVSVPSYPFSPEVEAFALTRGVRLIRVSRDDFESSALERLSLDHNVPAPEHWKLPFDWCERFIPRVDGLPHACQDAG